MGKKISLKQTKAVKIAEGEVLSGIYSRRMQPTRHGERMLHGFKDAKSGDVKEIWGTSLLDKSEELAAAIGKRVTVTKLNQGNLGAATEYDIEIE